MHLAMCIGQRVHCHPLIVRIDIGRKHCHSLFLALDAGRGEVANIVIHVAVLPQANGVWPPVLSHGIGGVGKRQQGQKAMMRTSGL